MWKKIALLCVFLGMLSGCFVPAIDAPEPVFSTSAMSQMIALSPVLLKLIAYSQGVNRDGLDEISTRYGVNVTTPTIRLCDAARDALIAYKAVAVQMTGRDGDGEKLREALGVGADE